MLAGLLMAPALKTNPAPAAAQTLPSTPQTVTGGAPVQDADPILRTLLDRVRTDVTGEGFEQTHAPRFLILTVPDPEATYLGYTLDTWVEALQRAAETAGFLYDHHWLPWRPAGSEQAAPRASQREGESAGTPGLILFRPEAVKSVTVNARETGYNGAEATKVETPPRSPLLLVFLVGETASGGLNRRMFQRAVDYAAEISRRFKTELPEVIRVVGPTFSGSLPSLRAAIQTARSENRRLRFHVATGSATNVSSESLTNLLPGASSDLFELMIENDDAVQKRFLSLLRDHYRIPESRVAMLSEAGTAFGQGFATSGNNGEAPHRFTFPMELARLRQAYQRDPELSALWSGKGGDAPKVGLDLPTRTSGQAADRIPAFSTDVTPLSQELMMGQIAREINRRQAMAVGINATDTLDAIFVGRLMQRWCPSVRLFSFNPDVLFLHATPNLSFFGMVLVGNYPLLGPHPAWAGEQHSGQYHLYFANLTTHATYNACLRQILHLTGHPEADSTKLLSQYGSPFHAASGAPPIWVTAIGRDGIWPLTVLDLDTAQSRIHRLKAPSGVDAPQPAPLAARFWHLLYWATAAWCVWGLLRLDSHYTHLLSGKLRVAFTDLPRQLAGPGHFYLMMDACARLAIFLLVAAPYLAGAIHPGGVGMAAVYAAGLLTILLLAVPLWLLLHVATGSRGKPAAVRIAMAYPPLALLIITMLFGLTWVLQFRWQCAECSGGADATRLFFAIRTTHPSSGLSPAFPLAALLFAVAAWSGMQLRLLRFQEISSQTLPVPASGDPLFAGVRQQMERLADQRVGIYRPWQYVLTLGVVLFAVLLVRPLESFRSLEGGWYDYLCLVLLNMVFGLLILGALHFATLWSNLSALLRRLKWHPLREAFSRIPREFGSHPMWGVDHRQIHLRGLVSSVGLMRRLASRNWLDKTIAEQTESNVQPLLEADGSNEPPDLKLLAAVNQHLDRCSAALLDGPLAIAWRIDPNTRSRAGLNPEAVEPAEDLAAIRISAFLRSVLVPARHVLRYLVFGFLLLVLAIHTYPFQPHRTLVLWISVLFVFLGIVITFVLVKMEKNPVLSWLTGTPPGKLELSFLVRIGTLGAMPLLTVASAQFPQLGRTLFSWVDPILQMLR